MIYQLLKRDDVWRILPYFVLGCAVVYPLLAASGGQVAFLSVMLGAGSVITGFQRATRFQAGLPIDSTPGPIVALPALPGQATRALYKALMNGGIYPTLIRYLNTSSAGYYRFVISSEHTMEQLGRLASVLTQTWPRLRKV